jgi:hypothetical protein
MNPLDSKSVLFSLSIKFDAISPKVVASGQAFNNFITYVLHKITGEMREMIEKGLSEIMMICDQRRHTRLRKNFQLTLHKRVPGIPDVLLEGNTLDLSKGGAFIKTEGWHFFEPNEVTELTLFLPPDFTDKDTLIGLQGSAIIRRVDRLREGISVEFINELRQFRPIAVC